MLLVCESIVSRVKSCSTNLAAASIASRLRVVYILTHVDAMSEKAWFSANKNKQLTNQLRAAKVVEARKWEQKDKPRS